MTKFLQKLGTIVLSLLLFNGGCSNKNHIVLGFVGELSGTQSELSVSARNAAILAVEEINNAGGINGKTIELLTEDDLGTPEGASVADVRLVQQGAQVIIGHMTSSQTLAGWEAIHDSGVILFSPTTSTPELSGKDDNFLRFIAENSREASLLAEHVAAQPNLKHVAILYDTDNAGYTETFQQKFSQVFVQAKGESPRNIPFHGRTALDFFELIEPLLYEPPDTIVIIASAYNAALIAQQLHLNQIDCPIFIALWARTEDLIRLGGNSVEGIQFISQYDTPAPSAKAQEFAQKFEQRYGNPPTFSAVVTYDVVYYLAAALKTAKDDNNQILKQILMSQSTYTGLLGRVQLNQYGDADRPQYLGIVQNGKFVGLYPVYIPPTP